jgi:hypothetical protein
MLVAPQALDVHDVATAAIEGDEIGRTTAACANLDVLPRRGIEINIVIAGPGDRAPDLIVRVADEAGIKARKVGRKWSRCG